MPKANACPYVWKLDHGPMLSADEQRAAAADPRCNDLSTQHQYGFFVDDGTALPVMTAASASDLAAATTVLKGGVSTPDSRERAATR